MRRGHKLALACALVALLLALASPASGLPLLHHDGRWLVDPQGRVVILHGLQVDRFEPGQPVEFIDMSPDNVRFMAAEGFNLARVSFAFAGLEPHIHQFDSSYLNQYLAFDRLLGNAGVYDLLDMMQGQYSAPLDGWGFPPWMTITSGAKNVKRRFPLGYFVNPAEEKAWDNLWGDALAADHVGLQEEYAFGLRLIASALRGSSGFLGLDLLNEPWPGSGFVRCTDPAGCPGFDGVLRAFYGGLVQAVRAVDPAHPIFYEPHLLFDQGVATHLGSIGDPNAVFAFHNYCAMVSPGLPRGPDGTCDIQEQFVLQNAQAQAAASGDGLLMDEWGDTTSTSLIDRMSYEADVARVGWAYWAYEDCCKSPGALVTNATLPPTLPGNLNVPVLNALVRPYPRLIAGTPGAWAFSPATDRFSLSYSPHALRGTHLRRHAQTEIELPALRYPTGYRAIVRGARIVSPPNANLLRLRSRRVRRVTVSITPANRHPASLGPFSWPAGSQPVAADCPPNSQQVVPLRVRHGIQARRIKIYVDGRHFSTVSGRRITKIRLPRGLADGSTVQLFASAAHGRRASAALYVRGCSVGPRPIWKIVWRTPPRRKRRHKKHH